jgi:hypothetical protein
MGTAISVDVRDAPIPLAVDRVFAWFRWVDETFSTYKSESQISRLRRGELSPAECDDRVGWVLDRCDEVRQGTGGFFDASASGTLYPSGLVKGCSVEVASCWPRRDPAVTASTPEVTPGGRPVFPVMPRPSPPCRGPGWHETADASRMPHERQRAPFRSLSSAA